MTPATIAQVVLLIGEAGKLAALLKDEPLTPEQEATVKAAVRQANDLWDNA